MKDIKFDKNILFKSFIDIDNFANTKMMTCYKTVFKKKNIIKNIGCFIFISFILLNIIFIFLFCCNYYEKLTKENEKFKLKILNSYKIESKIINSNIIDASKNNNEENILKKNRKNIIKNNLIDLFS